MRVNDQQRKEIEDVLAFRIECCADKPQFVLAFWALMGRLGIRLENVPREVVRASRELFAESDAEFAAVMMDFLQSLLAENEYTGFGGSHEGS